MGCGQSSVATDGSVPDEEVKPEREKHNHGVKKVKKEAKRRRSASGLLENLVHEEFDKGMCECSVSEW
jgi:hypothetical protein